MIRHSRTTIAAFLVMTGPALAESHVAATACAAEGESACRQCQSCHVVQDASGEVLAVRAARTGPNLYGLAGRTAGMLQGFRFSEVSVTAGVAGMVHDEATFVP